MRRVNVVLELNVLCSCMWVKELLLPILDNSLTYLFNAIPEEPSLSELYKVLLNN
jgi:hypothetical protein